MFSNEDLVNIEIKTPLLELYSKRVKKRKSNLSKKEAIFKNLDQYSNVSLSFMKFILPVNFIKTSPMY